MNYLREKLKEHIGHDVECVAYGDLENPQDICLECVDCGCVLVSAEDFDEEEFGLCGTDLSGNASDSEEESILPENNSSSENKELVLDLGFTKLKVSVGSDPNYNEIFVYLEDENGSVTQDIAIIGQHYHISKDLKTVQEDKINVRVFADKDNEDFTNQFIIEKYEPEEEG